MNRVVILAILRHLLTAAGGAASATGYASGSEIDAAIGAILTLVGVVLSMMDKRSR